MAVKRKKRREQLPLGVFSTAEKGLLLSTLAPKNADAQTRRELLDLFAEYARKDRAMWADQARDRRRKLAAAKAIQAIDERSRALAGRSLQLAEKAYEIARKAGILISRAPSEPAGQPLPVLRIYRLKGPRKIGLHYGADELARRYLAASGKRRLSKSRLGPLPEVLRIIYRVWDPLPIIKRIIAHENVERAEQKLISRVQDDRRKLLSAIPDDERRQFWIRVFTRIDNEITARAARSLLKKPEEKS